MLKDTSKKTANKRRDAGEVLQLHMQISKELSAKIDIACKEKGMTKAGWITYALEAIIDNGGAVTPVGSEVRKEDVDRLNNKLDTITNLLSSLITLSSAQ